MENDKRPREEDAKPLSAVERLKQRKRLEEEKRLQQNAQPAGSGGGGVSPPPPLNSGIATGRATPLPPSIAANASLNNTAGAVPAGRGPPQDAAAKHLVHKKSRRGMFGAPKKATAAAAGPPAIAAPSAAQVELLVNPDAVRVRKEAEVVADNNAYLAAECGAQPFLATVVQEDFLFGRGVPDVEWWDRQLLALPGYSCKTFVKDSITEMVHHPVGTLGRAQVGEGGHSSSGGTTTQQTLKLVKTKGEIRKERRTARDTKAKEHQELVARGDVKEEQQYKVRNLNDVLKEQETLAPTATRQLLESQYVKRQIGHERRNFDRHWDAVAQQDQKKEDDKWKLVSFAPRVALFRLFTVTDKHTVEKIKIHLNDSRLKGAVFWIDKRDVVVAVVGGVRVVRKLEKYLCHRLLSQLPTGTRSVKVFEGHTHNPAWFHFNPDKKQPDPDDNDNEQQPQPAQFEREFVYVKEVEHYSEIADAFREMDARVGTSRTRISLSLLCALDAAVAHDEFVGAEKQ